MTRNDRLSMVAYYLSKFDLDAVNRLGYENRSQAIRETSRKLGGKNEYMKRRRDEFDVLTGSHRRGQCNRPPIPSVVEYHREFQHIDFEEFTGRVVQLLIDADNL